MLIGGTAFSTAGGIKVGRFIVLYEEFTKKSERRIELQLLGLLHPHRFLLKDPYRSTEF